MSKKVAHQIKVIVHLPKWQSGAEPYDIHYLCGKVDRCIWLPGDPPIQPASGGKELTPEQHENFPPECKKCDLVWKRKLKNK